MKIFIAEDDVRIREELKNILETEGFSVTVSEEFSDVLGNIRNESPDLILLDLGLPGRDGFSILRNLRKESIIPVIILTSRNGETEEILGMNLGADDFVSKPFNPEILLLRINAVLKRSGVKGDISGGVIRRNGISLDTIAGKIYSGENESDLTRNEIRILSLLFKKGGKIVTRDELMEELWSMDEFVDDNTLTVNINRVRKKLKELSGEDIIKTKRGLGYMVE